MGEPSPPTEIPERDFRRSPEYRELQRTKAEVAARRREARAQRFRRWRQEFLRVDAVSVGTWPAQVRVAVLLGTATLAALMIWRAVIWWVSKV